MISLELPLKIPLAIPPKIATLILRITAGFYSWNFL